MIVVCLEILHSRVESQVDFFMFKYGSANVHQYMDIVSEYRIVFNQDNGSVYLYWGE